MLPFCLILGPSLSAAVIPSFIAFPLTVLAILFLYENSYEGSAEKKLMGFSFLFALSVTSPLLVSSASWVMVEIFGVLLTSLVFGFYFQARQSNLSKSYKICAILSFLLLTLKYNYGLFVLLVLFFGEITRNLDWIRSQRFSLKTFRPLFKPVLYPAYALFFLIMWIALTEGDKINVFGFKLSLTNIYNPIMYLYLYLLIVVVFKLKKNWLKIKEKLKIGQKELLLWGVLPVGIFLALPDKIKAIIKNLEAGRKVKSGFSLEQVMFYLRSLGQDYSLFLPLGIFVLVLFGLAIIKIKRTPSGIRYLMLFFLLGYVLIGFIFQLREGRFIANFVPALWVISAWMVDFISKKISIKYKAIVAAFISILAIVISLFSPILVHKAKKQPWAPWARHQMIYRSLINPVIEKAENAQNVFVSGNKDLGFGPLLEWKLQIAHFKQRNFKLKLDDLDAEKNNDHTFLEMINRADIEMIFFYIVQEGESENRLKRWTQLLKQSDRYELIEEEFYEEPKPFHLLIFSKKFTFSS